MLQEQEYVGLLIGAARRSIKQAVLRAARPLQLTPPQFWFLNAARELPGASLGDVARRQHMDPPTASRIAEGLAERGVLPPRCCRSGPRRPATSAPPPTRSRGRDRPRWWRGPAPPPPIRPRPAPRGPRSTPGPTASPPRSCSGTSARRPTAGRRPKR